MTPTQIKVLILAALMGLAFGSGFYLRDLQADRKEARSELSITSEALDTINERLAEAATHQEKLAAQLAKLPSSATVEAIIRENPSLCYLPDPVADSLREQANQGRAVRRSP